MARFANMKKVSIIALIVVFTVFCSCRVGEQHKREAETREIQRVKIGVVAPFEGTNAHIGDMIMNSVNLYFAQHSMEGFEVETVPIDTKSSPSDAVAAMQTAAANEDIVALIGFYHSSTALASKTIVQEAKLPTLIYSASNPDVTKEAPYYFRLVPTDASQAVVLAEYAQGLGAQRIGILYYADEYGQGLAEGIKARTAEIGMEVVDEQSYDAATTDFRPKLTVMKSKNPDVIMICGFVEKSIAILNQAAEKGVEATFLAGDGTFNEEQLIEGAGDNSEGVFVAAPYVFDESNSDNARFLEAYWASYDPEHTRRKPASWSAFAYDAAGILAKAFEAGHRDRSSITAFLKGMNSESTAYRGITGMTYFDAQGDAIGRKFKLAKVEGGHFVAVN